MPRTRGAKAAGSSSGTQKRGRNDKGKNIAVEEVEAFDSTRFVSQQASDDYNTDKGWNFIKERFVTYERAAYPSLYDQIEKRGWTHFLKRPTRDVFAGEIVREFYANARCQNDDNVAWVRGVDVNFDPETINAYYQIEWPSNRSEDFVYGSLQDMKDYLTIDDTILVGKIPHNRLTKEAKAWSVIMCSHIAPTSYNTLYGDDRIPLLYQLTRGLKFDVGKEIHKWLLNTIRRKSPNLKSFIFPHLINGLCLMAGVEITDIREEVKLSNPINTNSICMTLNLTYVSERTGRRYNYGEVPQAEQIQVPQQQRVPRGQELLFERLATLERNMNEGFNNMNNNFNTLSTYFSNALDTLVERQDYFRNGGGTNPPTLPPHPTFHRPTRNADEMHIDEEEDRDQ